ncbi:unnamed protein product [Linum trigynum]|uniref:F-box domain-containing protein n=1 Tax=Linum trigynum TaxID=586398 RepID=A0AAV2C8Q8_9ROSI
MAAGSAEGFQKPQLQVPIHGVVGSEETGGRLSNLPDNILHHILSFLDTKHVVRTSVLSRRWRSQWKNAHALNFFVHHYTVREAEFREHVVKFLSRRRGPDAAAVSSVTIDVSNLMWKQEKLEMDLFDKVMKYVARRRGSSNNSPPLRRLAVCGCPGLKKVNYINFTELAGSVMAHRHHESLEAVELGYCNLQSGDAFGSVRFGSLTNLELRGCTFSSVAAAAAAAACCDPFVDLPSLSHLKLDSCLMLSAGCSLRISGLELLSLEILSVHSPRGIDVVAPKLKFFLYYDYSAVELENLDLPSLDCAMIRVSWGDHQWGRNTAVRMRIQKNEEYMKLLRGLHNATSLTLRFAKNYCGEWKEHQFPFNNMKSSMESEASPFTRLKILRVEYPQDPPIAPNDHVIRYFFEGSSNVEEKIVKFEKGHIVNYC